MVDRSWVHVLIVIFRGCVWEKYIWVLPALLQRLKGWVGDQPVSAQTIRRTLHQIGLHDCRPRRKPLLKSSMVVGVSWSGAAWVLPVLGSYSSLREPWMITCTVTYWSRAWSPPFGGWAAGQYSNMITTTALLKKLRLWTGQACLQTKTLSICGASSNRRWRSARSLTSTSSVMSSWRSGRGLQWQPVKLWWTPSPRGLRQCWEIICPHYY